MNNETTTAKERWQLIYKGFRHPDWYITKLEPDSVIIECRNYPFPDYEISKKYTGYR